MNTLCIHEHFDEAGSKYSQKEPLEKGLPNVNTYGGVAQLGEHLLCKQGVIGSIPFISTKTGS